MNYEKFKYHSEQANFWLAEFEKQDDFDYFGIHAGEQFKNEGKTAWDDDYEIQDDDIMKLYKKLCERNYESHRQAALQAYKSGNKQRKVDKNPY